MYKKGPRVWILDCSTSRCIVYGRAVRYRPCEGVGGALLREEVGG